MTSSRAFWVALAIGVAASPALAEPRFASRAGASCASCHVNPTGGGLRNAFARNVFETTTLTSSLARVVGGGFRLDPEIGGFLAFGGDFRGAFLAQLTSDARAGAREALLFSRTSTPYTFFPMQADLYVAAFLGEHVTLYSDVGVHGSFEVFGLLDDLPFGAYVKAGFFTPPFGTKLPNHTASVRAPIGFDPRGKDAGIEVGVIRPWLELSAAVQNGELAGDVLDQSPGKSLSARGAVIETSSSLKLHLGGSVYGVTREEPLGAELTGTTTEWRAGPFFWVTVGRLTWMGELDVVLASVAPDEELSPRALASYQELALLLVRGLDVALSYEHLARAGDRGLANGVIAHRGGISVQWFPLPYVELNAIYRAYASSPALADEGQHEIIGFLHLFF